MSFPLQRKTIHTARSRHISPKLWSVIPKNIRDLPALSVFRQHIRKLGLNSFLMLIVLIVFYVVHNRHFGILVSLYMYLEIVLCHTHQSCTCCHEHESITLHIISFKTICDVSLVSDINNSFSFAMYSKTRDVFTSDR